MFIKTTVMKTAVLPVMGYEAELRYNSYYAPFCYFISENAIINVQRFAGGCDYSQMVRTDSERIHCFRRFTAGWLLVQKLYLGVVIMMRELTIGFLFT